MAMKSIDQSFVLQETDKILQMPIGQRLPELRKLFGVANKLNNDFLTKLLNGLIEYHFATDEVKTFNISKKLSYLENQESSFEQEIQVRENAISRLTYSIGLLQEAMGLLTNFIDSDSEAWKFKKHLDLYIYRSNISSCRQKLVLNLNNLEYHDARNTAQIGLDCAKKQSQKFVNFPVPKNIQADLDIFAGALKEIEAFEKFSNKPLWEVKNSDFREAAKLFEQAVECLERASISEIDKDRLASVPRAWSYLLKFMSNPTLTNFGEYINFSKLENSSIIVKANFTLLSSNENSKRKQRSARISQFIKSSVIKTASWNIFSEIRYNLNLIETSANDKIDLLAPYFLERGMDKKRLERYLVRPENKEQKPEVTCDRFISDLETTTPDLLPTTLKKNQRPSIVIANDIYHFCKHQKMQVDFYSITVDKFSTEFLERISKEFETLKRLSIDTDDLLKRLNKLSVTNDS